MLSAPLLPARVRLGNRLLALVQRVGPARVNLQPDALVQAAIDQTGLQDFGDAAFTAGFTRLLLSLEQEARLSPLGRIIARQEILMALTNRQQLLDYHRRFPEIGTAPVSAPIFIIGMGRSGTSIMHELLAQDAQFRVPQTWEVDHPFPPPETATYATDPRIAATQRTLDRTDLVLPAFKGIHRMGATLPQECVRFTTSEFLSLIFWTNYNVPEYARWLRTEADMAPAYHYHRRFLQLLQWRHPGTAWVLKSPAHLWSLGELLDTYPDARFIQTHRDPLRMLASLTSLVAHLRKMSSDHVDPGAIAREWAQWNAMGLNASAQFRQDGRIPPGRVVDVDFHAFMAAPLDEMEKIYAALGLSFTDTTREAMRRYLERHTAEEHGAHRYSFADTGLDRDEERERVETYQDYFGTAVEV